MRKVFVILIDLTKIQKQKNKNDIYKMKMIEIKNFKIQRKL